MEHWKRTILKGNSCFNRGDLIDARELYLQALALAQVLLERWVNVDEAVAAFVISHHNLADVHLSLNQPEESAEYLCAAHQRLLDVIQNIRLKPALRLAALRNSNKTYSELLNFTQQHGEYPGAHRLLTASDEHSHSAFQHNIAAASSLSFGVH
jgi:tetratricopeptide (TPR) repeat protein